MNNLTFLLRKNTVVIELANVTPKIKDNEVLPMILGDLKVPVREIKEMSIHSIQNNLLLTLVDEEKYQVVLDKIRQGFFWEERKRTLYGWSAQEYLTTVQIFNWTNFLSLEKLLETSRLQYLLGELLISELLVLLEVIF